MEVGERPVAKKLRVSCDSGASYPEAPCPLRFATDSLIASTHGIIAFALRTHSLDWSSPLRMVEQSLEMTLLAWCQLAHTPRGNFAFIRAIAQRLVWPK